MVWLALGTALWAEDAPPAEDQEFLSQLDGLKDPFDNGIPPPPPVVVPPPPPPVVQPPPLPMAMPHIKLPPVVRPRIVPPVLNLQGVIVGEGIQRAIIDDKVVAVHQRINGVTIASVTTKGVGYVYKGKKFFLKID